MPPSGTLPPAGVKEAASVTTVPVAAPPAAPLQDAIPELATLPTPSQAAKKEETVETPAVAAVAGPAADDRPTTTTDKSTIPGPPAFVPPTSATSTDLAAAPVSLPGMNLPVPVPSGTPAPTVAASPSANTLVGSSESMALPPKPAIRTWGTTLAPAIAPMTVTYNYKRQLLPSTIYRTSYDRENDHLPKAVTREDYIALLYASAAANDVNATRALLNTGLQANMGEALAVARRAGANDTARLLIARGAS